MRLIDAEKLIRYTILNPNHTPYITRKDIDAQPTIEERSVPFSAIRKICKYYSISRDMYDGGEWESACHHPELVLSGDSWGKCSIDTCPLYVEKESK